MDQLPILKSPFKQKKEAEDDLVYSRFTELMAIPGAQVLEVTKLLLQEFPNIYAASTIWAIRKRVEKRLAQQIENIETN